MIKTITLKLEEMPIGVRMLVEYKMSVNLLQQKVDEITKKYALPDINYKYFWDLEVEIHKVDKNLRGW